MKLRSTLYLIPVCLIAIAAFMFNEQPTTTSYEARNGEDLMAQSAAGQFEYKKNVECRSGNWRDQQRACN